MPEQMNITAAEIDEGAEHGEGLATALDNGRLVATVVSRRSGDHITIQARCKARGDDGKWQTVGFGEATHVFLDVPSEGGYGDKVATYYPTGKQAGKLWPDLNADPARIWAARFVLSAAAGREVSDQAEILQGVTCLACGRELTDPDSIAANIGPDCRRKATEARHQRKQRPQPASQPLPPAAAPGRPEAPAERSEAPSALPEPQEGLFRLGGGSSALDRLRDLEATA